ncbi:MAG: CoA pyrophosphatase [Prolixibacteraceae bacterium]|jgi:8-oxo-dGTP pyrophosphatase MutT (NUDIX family)|nr:CoA pyrophosphatase [Prolixibacteraceae bacterium]
MRYQAEEIKIDTIYKILEQSLPGIKAHSKMLPKGRSLSYANKIVRESAVLILLYPENNKLYFCLTQRNSNLKHHPGQISFPGGRCENHDSNPSETALRETEEEIGVNSSTIKLLGQLSDVYVSVSNFNIHTFIGWVPKKPQFKLNASEVEKIITLPLHSIRKSQNHSTETINTSNGKMLVPCYKIEDYVIWGATSMMIAELEVLLEKHYSRREEH